MRKLLLAALLCLAPFSAQAATCYWVGGTSFNTAANWSATNSGGGGGTCAATGGIPKNAGDVAQLDTSAPASTTLLLDIDLASIATINMQNLTGGSGFDFNGHNVTFTSSFLANGSGTRTLNLGSGTITLNAGVQWNMVTTTNLTYNPGTATIVFVPSSIGAISFFGGGPTFTYNTFSFNGGAPALVSFEPGNNTGVKVNNIAVTTPVDIQLRGAQTFTVVNGFSLTASAASPIYFTSDNSAVSPATLAVGASSSCVWCVFRSINGATSTITATNSLGLGGTGGTLSISTPGSGGGGAGYIIGGQ